MVCLDDSEIIAKAVIAKAMLSVRLARQGRTMGDFHVSVCDGWMFAYANFWCSRVSKRRTRCLSCWRS
jgi:hypothetical protein